MLSDLQKRTIKAIVNIFETGRVKGDYGKVTLLRGDSGHLTYGRSQTTLASGNLYLLIKDYCNEESADLADELSTFLGRLEQRDLTLDQDHGFRALLKQAGDDPVMQEVQDSFFDRVYWEPCLKSAEYIGSQLPLGVALSTIAAFTAAGIASASRLMPSLENWKILEKKTGLRDMSKRVVIGWPIIRTSY